jgi:ABC-type dipeptide/oligopeptide/nickel transport system permease component
MLLSHKQNLSRNTVRKFDGLGLGRYVIRILLYMIPLFLGISMISFVVMYAAGDPIQIATAANPRITPGQQEALRKYYGLDQPVPVQYVNWLRNLLQGNFGNSFYGGRPVNELIGSWLWETVKLQLVSIVLSLVISIPMGIYAALKQYSKTDVAIEGVALFGVSMPAFWIGIILILIFSYYLGWLPSAGAYGAPNLWRVFGVQDPTLDAIAHIILPAAVLTYLSLALNVRLIRASMLEVLRQDYILAAKASGLKNRTVIYKHALRNAITPVVTFLGLSIGALLAGAPLTETVFSWPGLGRRFVTAAGNLDFPVVMGITMLITIMTLVANLVTDLSYAWIDPRIRVE